MSDPDDFKELKLSDFEEARRIARGGGSPTDMYDPAAGQWIKVDGKLTEYGERFFAKYAVDRSKFNIHKPDIVEEIIDRPKFPLK